MSLHQGQRVVHGGTPLHTARAAAVLLHGRGASADDILSLGESASEEVSCISLLAPQAAGHAWYPNRFLAPLEENEPYLSSAIAAVAGIVSDLVSHGIPRDKVVVAGFSQGACLALEFAWRNPGRYGGIVALSGALIGPPGAPRMPCAGLERTPVYLGCGDRDEHIPASSVEESARALAGAGASITKTLFPGMGHIVVVEEIREFRSILMAAAASA